LKLSTVLVKTKNNIRARICFKTNTKTKTWSLLNLQLLDSRDHDLGLKRLRFRPRATPWLWRRPPPSTIPTVLLDIKGTTPTVHQSSTHPSTLPSHCSIPTSHTRCPQPTATMRLHRLSSQDCRVARAATATTTFVAHYVCNNVSSLVTMGCPSDRVRNDHSIIIMFRIKFTQP